MIKKKSISWCINCVTPDSRPNIKINPKGVCNACESSFKKRYNINWNKRKKEFLKITKNIKRKKSNYDCIIPVSGGKDSTWQTLTALEYGLKPLCITWRTPVRTEVGKKNLQNLINLGVDHYDVSINPKIEKEFSLKTFKKLGSPAIPMHMALHAIPVNLAIKLKVPLILWGENSAFEYGGSDSKLKGSRLNNDWRKKYGNYYSLNLEKWTEKNFSYKDLSIYSVPSDRSIKKARVQELFLGHFFKWDPIKIYKIVKKYNFKTLKKAKIGLYKFADIDDDFIISIHHWMKWYKFGFTRLFDNLSIEIRNGRISRLKAIKILKKQTKPPVKEIKKFCEYVKITEKQFYNIAEKFRNKRIWTKINNKKWIIKNFLF